ncbi:hypothetical protein [Saccharothrix xinjiangensis]|uniref:Uncharacterized protein n=1 Tax=Saccharothrix xinjiangensis TaxID=204798 RepID=A0ABV9XVR0_9PSEU
MLLIDVANAMGMAGTPRVEALLAAGGPVHHAVAACAARGDLVGDPLDSHLAELRIGAVAVDPAPDAAELVLLAHAHRVHATLG